MEEAEPAYVPPVDTAPPVLTNLLRAKGETAMQISVAKKQHAVEQALTELGGR